jgi:hypothetical protein
MSPAAEAYFTHEHDDHPVRLSSAEDVDQLIDALAAESWENTVAAVYVDDRLNQAGVPDHELLVAVDHENKAVGALRYMGGDGTYFSQGDARADGSVLYYYMGSDREFPRASAVPLNLVRTAVKEFLLSGGERPTVVNWAEESPG